jgi:ClpP class serine protease
MSNGASLTTGGVWTNASSRALKENIENLNADEAVAALTKLNPVKYNYKIDKTDKHVGFIAEDAPELVATSDRKGMSPMDVVAVLTKVVQEQQKVNQEQQEVIANLHERITKIEKAK